MINFDTNGNVIPYEILEVSLNIIQKEFTFNDHREGIFEEYLAFCDTLKSIGVNNFYQFIDGSFITKKTFPKDIDLVTFVNADFFNRNAVKLLNLRDKFSKIDCFFVPNYHPKRKIIL